MAFTTDMVYLRYDFRYTVEDEIQTFGIWGAVSKEGVGVTPGWQTMVDAISKKGRDTWNDEIGGGSYSPSVQAIRCVAYHYDADLKNVLDRGESVFDADDSWSGTASNGLPPQDTVALSLWGYDPTKYQSKPGRHRGRIYLPTPGASAVDGTGRLTSTYQGNLLTAATAWFNALTGVLDNGQSPDNIMHWRPRIVSRAGGTDGLVKFLRVGQVVDTQRRRRNNLQEHYVTHDVNQP